MGIFQRLFAKKKLSEDEFAQAGASLGRERLVRMFERPSSFSIVAISGDVSSDIPGFLSACNYELGQIENYVGEFAQLYASIEQPYGPNNSFVKKAWYQAAGHTILLDPEMVLITRVADLSQMAVNTAGSIVVAIWERVSETVALSEFGPMGIVRESWYCQGEPSQEPIAEYPEISNQPDCDGLKAALAGYGLHTDALLGYVDATVVELKE